MAVEIRQMVVKSSVTGDADGGREGRKSAELDPAELELLRNDLLAACKKMIAESLREKKER
ncbi:MAG TPA: DUF5908 family protein [Rhodocyclaceae bacterium]